VERHDLRSDQGDTSTLALMQDNNQMLLKHLLEASYPEKSDVGGGHHVCLLMLTWI